MKTRKVDILFTDMRGVVTFVMIVVGGEIEVVMMANLGVI